MQSLERVGRKGGRCNERRSPLEGEPRVAQALCRRGSFLWDQLQHGNKEVGEALSFFAGPLVLVNQHLQQAPRLQLGDVFQITWRWSDRQSCVRELQLHPVNSLQQASSDDRSYSNISIRALPVHIFANDISKK